jgi:glycerol 3-phosphatase-2
VTQPAKRGWLRASTRPLCEIYDVALLDLDGVVYLGPQPISGAPEALARARAAGMRLAFVTNNASRRPGTVAAHLRELGVPADDDDVVTSAQAAIRLIAQRAGAHARVLVTGSPALRDMVTDAGLRVVRTADDHPDAVLQGYWDQLAYADLAEAAIAVRAGALWVAANADTTLPSPRGQLPGNGALVGVIVTTTGRRPVVAGKPELPVHAEGVRRTGARNPIVVGDRLDTDIEGAFNATTDSLLVLTGVTTIADLAHAAPPHRPGFVAADLAGLLVVHPAVEADADVSRCGGWRARRVGHGVEVKGHGTPLDGVRAVLALAWCADDAGSPLDGVEQALGAFGG